MNEYIERLLKYCNENKLTILKLDAKDNTRWDMSVLRNEGGKIENIYYDKWYDKWDFE